MKHTKEPWIVIDSDPYHGTYIEDEHGDTVCDLYVLDEINNEPIQQINAESNARRIVACVNSCAGFTTLFLESLSIIGETLNSKNTEIVLALHKAEKERNELLSALKEIESANWHFSMSRKIAKEAIEKAEAIK